MLIKARYVAVIAGALAAMTMPGTAHANDHGALHEGPGMIRNVGLGGCLTAVDDGAGGAVVRVKPCDGSFSQIWLTRSLYEHAAGKTIAIRKNARDCLQLIGEDLPVNGRLALRDCDDDHPHQAFHASVADWSVPTWRVSGSPAGSWLKAYHEHEAPYVSQTKEWPGGYAEWEYAPVGG